MRHLFQDLRQLTLTVDLPEMAESDLGLNTDALLGDGGGDEASGLSALLDATEDARDATEDTLEATDVVLDDGDVTLDAEDVASGAAPSWDGEGFLEVTEEDLDAEELARDVVETALDADEEAP